MLVLLCCARFGVLDSRKRLLGGAVISVVGLGTALLFRKPPEEPRAISWPSGFTEVQPSAPLANPTPPEPVQPKLAGRIEALVEGAPTATASFGSMYQLPSSASPPAANGPGSPAASVDPFLRGGSSFSLPALSVANDKPSSDKEAHGHQASEVVPPANVYTLTELKPLIPTDQATTPTPASLTEPAKLDTAQQSAALSLVATPAVEHSSGYRWSPNRSSVADPPPANGSTALAERPSLLAPPPMAALPSAPSSTMTATSGSGGYQLPRADSTPSLAMPSYGYAPAPPLMSPSVANAPLQPTVSGMRHRIADGDTLASIARRYYGDEQRARELYELNRNVLRDPELLPIGTELVVPGGAPNSMAPPTAAPMSQTPAMTPAVPPLLAPPPLEQFGPRTLAVSTSSWRGAHEPAQVSVAPAAPLAPVALSPWDQQLANAAPLQQAPSVNQATPPRLYSDPVVNAPPSTLGWPAAPPSAPLGNTASAPQVGWPPQPASTPAGWPARAWNTSESAMNWVGNKVLGTSSPAPPVAGSKTYLVRPLETWETLAQRFYGETRHAATLQSANPQVPPGSKIRPGTVINVPAMPL